MSGLKTLLRASLGDKKRVFSSRRFYSWLGITVAVMACLWTAFAKLIVRPIIESAYRGESLFPFLNRYFTGLDRPLERILARWDLYTQDGLMACLGFGLIALIATNPTFFRKYVKEATPESLGAIRILTSAILLGSTLCSHLASSVHLPPQMRESMGVMQFFHALPIGFERFLGNEIALQVFSALTAVILFLGMVGWQTRFSIPLGAFCFFLQGGILREYAHYWHQELLPLYVMAVLSLTPCGDALSVDRLWKISRGQAVPAADRPLAVYGWSRYACWVVIALVYITAGLSKLRFGGLFWWNATNMRAILYTDTLQPTSFDWNLSLHLTQAPDIFFALLGLVGILSELGYGTVLFSSTARLILPFSIMMLHTGIFFLQNVAFFDLIVLQLVFFDFTEIRKAIGRRLATRFGSIHVLYDGLCPFCRRTVRILDSLDLFDLLKFINFRHMNLSDYNRNNKQNLKLRALEEEMYVVFRGRAYRGFYGYRVIALFLPAFWPLAPWLFLPGISSVGVLVYGYVARNRLKLIQCDSNCTLTLSPAGELTAAPPARNQAQDWRYCLLIPSLIILMLLVWVFRIEFYPFTAWQMYSVPNNSGTVTFHKVFLKRESGETSRAYFEDVIGATKAGRYGKATQGCFVPEKADLCQKFLAASAQAYNHQARAGEKVTQFEVQQWLWDFRAYPLGPQHGTLAQRFVFEVKNR